MSPFANYSLQTWAKELLSARNYFFLAAYLLRNSFSGICYHGKSAKINPLVFPLDGQYYEISDRSGPNQITPFRNLARDNTFSVTLSSLVIQTVHLSYLSMFHLLLASEFYTTSNVSSKANGHCSLNLGCRHEIIS